MQLRQNILEQIEHLLSMEFLSIPNVCFFMQSIRILIEIDQCQSKYQITSHYCNWLLHKKLDRSNSPTIILNIAESFNVISSKNDLIKKINEAISLKKLVSELKEILWLKMPNKKFVSQMDFEENWFSFIKVVLNQVLYRPLLLKEKNVVIDKFNFSIYGIQIVAEKEKYNIELLSKELEIKNKRIIIDIAFFRDI